MAERSRLRLANILHRTSWIYPQPRIPGFPARGGKDFINKLQFFFHLQLYMDYYQLYRDYKEAMNKKIPINQSVFHGILANMVGSISISMRVSPYILVLDFWVPEENDFVKRWSFGEESYHGWSTYPPCKVPP